MIDAIAKVKIKFSKRELQLDTAYWEYNPGICTDLDP